MWICHQILLLESTPKLFSISNRNSTFLANTYAINKEREVQFCFRVLLIRNHSSFPDFIDCLLMEKIESQPERYNNINYFKWVWLTELSVRHCKKVEPFFRVTTSTMPNPQNGDEHEVIFLCDHACKSVNLLLILGILIFTSRAAAESNSGNRCWSWEDVFPFFVIVLGKTFLLTWLLHWLQGFSD